jgi:hypothetical protein
MKLKAFEVAPHRYAVEVVAFDGEPPARTLVADPASAMSVYVEALDEMDELGDDCDDDDFLGVVRILRRRGGEWEDSTDWCVQLYREAGKYLYL